MYELIIKGNEIYKILYNEYKNGFESVHLGAQLPLMKKVKRFRKIYIHI